MLNYSFAKKIEKGRLILLTSIFYLLFSIFHFSFAQENKSDILKSKKMEVIDGKKYYLHAVEKGQTLYAISKVYSISVNNIVIENPEAIDGISLNQVLKIPAILPAKEVLSRTDSSKYMFHKVEQGQTIYSLSKTFSISIETISALNPELKDGLKLGMILKLPSGKSNIVKEKEKKAEKKIINSTDSGKLHDINVDEIRSKLKESKNVISNTKETNKTGYNIALLLPFYLDEYDQILANAKENENIELPKETQVALEFYQGALMAFDSLKKEGFVGKLFVYDLNDNDTGNVKLNLLLKRPEMASMNLIVGPLYGSRFVDFENFTKENKIHIAAPLSNQSKILFTNPYSSKVMASSSTQVEQMAKYVGDKHRQDNVIILNSNVSKDAPFINAFKNTLKLRFPIESSSDSAKQFYFDAKDFNSVREHLSLEKNNVIVFLSNNQAYVTDMITRLNTLSDKYKITLFGMQSWSKFDNLDIEYLNNLHLHFPVNSFVDYENPGTIDFIRKYKELFAIHPEIHSFQGFDATYFYLKAMKDFGPDFQQKLPEISKKGMQTSFNFYKTSVDSGYENRSVYIVKYDNYTLIKVN